MMHGDISNEVEDVVAFRVEDSILKFPTGLKKVFFGTKGIKIDPDMQRLMETVYRRTPLTVDLVIENKNNTDAIRKLLEDNVAFSRVVLINSELDISGRIMSGDISWYVDSNEERRLKVNSPYAIGINELYQIVVRRRY